MPARTAFKVATISKAGASAVATIKPASNVGPSSGAIGKTITVLMATPMAKAGTKAKRFSLLVEPMAAPAIAMPKAIGACSMPIGKPLITAVERCPKPQTSAPSVAPKSRATKKPANESNAIELAGSGFM